MKTAMEIMQWRLENQGFTPTLSKRSQTLLLKWAENKGLKAEGFDIEIFEADNPIARQRDQMNWLVDYVHDKYDPDWILPLDDDE